MKKIKTTKNIYRILSLVLTAFVGLSVACEQPIVQKPEENLYTLTFNANGGTGTMSPITGTPNTEIRLPKCTFTKDGAPFYGWATEPGGGKVAGDEATWLLTEKESTLYALYMKAGVEYVTVTFYAQNGTDLKTQQKLVLEENSTLDTNSFSYEGHTFKGWATSADNSSVVYTDGASVSLSADLNLYAVWEKEIVTPPPLGGTGVLTFNANGGNGTMDPVTGLEEGVTFTLPKNTFTKDGFIFIGWSTVEGYNEPSFQDQSSFYTYYAGTSKLYAVWAEKEEVVCISFDANGGDGTMDSIYVKRGVKFSMPANTFTPPADKPYYTCNSYGDLKSPDTMSTYRFSGFYSFNENTTLYAYWTPPSDLSIGGASEKYKGQTVWSPGVNVKEEDWVQVSDKPEKYFAERKSNSGWYDASQGTFNFCWAASATNVIHWWLDRNKENVDRFFALQGKQTPDFSYPGKGESKVFGLFVKEWVENKGGFTNIGFNWFVNIDNNEAIQPSARGKAAYFKDVFGNTSLSDSQGSLNRRNFNEFIVKALDEGKLIAMSELNAIGGHAITCWGFEFDKEGYICAMYYTDSASDWNNYFQDKELCLGKINIKYDTKWEPYMETAILMGNEVKTGRIGLIKVWSFDQGKEQWDAYFASHPGN